jgi:Legionella pneumophila major outer membrane protein precursor
MRNMKCLSVALIAIGLSTPVMAHSTATNGAVFVPSQNGGFKISVDALYLRENPVNKMVKDTYDWGTYAQVGYLFPQTGNDLTLEYTYLRDNDEYKGTTIDDIRTSLMKGTEDCNLDVVDLEGGQHIIGDALDIRLFAGARYTRLSHQLGLNTVLPLSYEDKDVYQSLDTTFHGIGPRLGADARYHLGYGFGLDAHVNTSFLVGTLNTKYQSNNTAIKIHSDANRVIPTLDAKLGFDCTHGLSEKDKSAVIFEIGYQSSNYFNVVEGSALNSSGDVSFNGVYLDIKYTS